MSEYHKIQTVFKRDPATNMKTLLEGEYSEPEFEYLKDNVWTFTEKVDGTNVRVIITPEGGLIFGGKTDNSQIHSTLTAALEEMFRFQLGGMVKKFPEGAILYGEGYGPKIQKGGGKYLDKPSFILFDVRVGNWWLKRDSIEEVGLVLDIAVVPILGWGTLSDMVDRARPGFKSEWGDFQAEGIVARPETELANRNGNRIITKIKCKDFRS